MAHSQGPIPRVVIVRSTYNASVTGAMLDGALKAFRAMTGAPDDAMPVVVEVAGAFELPIAAHRAASRRDVEGVLTIGCVIRGETTHDQHLNTSVASAIQRSALMTATPISFGVLTTNDAAQAHARAVPVGDEVDLAGSGNKGVEAMVALIHAVRACDAAAQAMPYTIEDSARDKAVPTA